jgi:Domain of unknown function (DUF1708)
LVTSLYDLIANSPFPSALDMPFLLLPFRPGLDTIGAKNFVRNYFKTRYESQADPKAFARRELLLMEPIVSMAVPA